MKFHDADQDYVEAKRLRHSLMVEVARLTSEIDDIQLAYLRDGVHTAASKRAELNAQRSATRLEIQLMTESLENAKHRIAKQGRNDLFTTLMAVLDEHGQGHHLKTALARLGRT